MLSPDPNELWQPNLDPSTAEARRLSRVALPPSAATKGYYSMLGVPTNASADEVQTGIAGLRALNYRPPLTDGQLQYVVDAGVVLGTRDLRLVYDQHLYSRNAERAERRWPDGFRTPGIRNMDEHVLRGAITDYLEAQVAGTDDKMVSAMSSSRDFSLATALRCCDEAGKFELLGVRLASEPLLFRAMGAAVAMGASRGARSRMASVLPRPHAWYDEMAERHMRSFLEGCGRRLHLSIDREREARRLKADDPGYDVPNPAKQRPGRSLWTPRRARTGSTRRGGPSGFTR